MLLCKLKTCSWCFFLSPLLNNGCAVDHELKMEGLPFSPEATVMKLMKICTWTYLVYWTAL